MSAETKRIVDKAWNFATVLWHDGVPFLSYTEEITFLLFLKMADELAKPPYSRPPLVPPNLGWPSLLGKSGEALKHHYDHVLAELGRKPGMLGDVFKRAKSAVEKPATLERLIHELIDAESWVSMAADVKGDIYEGLIARSMSDGGQGAGQYFTPRDLIDAVVDCVRPTADDTVCDPAWPRRNRNPDPFCPVPKGSQASARPRSSSPGSTGRYSAAYPGGEPSPGRASPEA